MPAGHRCAGLFNQLQHVPIANEDACQVREAVPSQLEEAEIERDRIEAEITPDDCADY
jgi:hypothetical protein